MNVEIMDETVTYTGKELRSGWIRERAGLAGEAAVGFVGPCRVANEDLVDLDDARAGEFIESKLMAHVIVEHTDCELRVAVLRQRLLVSLLCEILATTGHRTERRGDDVYYKDRKLTVSIAAPSASSSVIHLGINVIPDGAPVPAIGLEEMNVGARALLAELLERYRTELESCRHAEGKVRSVP